MKCEICSKKIEETFLNKIIGTSVKDEKHKLHHICFECQKRFTTKQEILSQLK